jgi:prepilin-type N-terminal cleavage/methylation domain-containing protein
MQHKHVGGFSFIELIVAISIIGILVILGMVSYNAQIVKSNRTIAQQIMMQNSINLEIYYSQYGSYLNGSSWPTAILHSAAKAVNGELVYDIKMFPELPTASNQQQYFILAVPQPNSIQANDGNLCLSHNGTFIWPATDTCLLDSSP